MKSKFENALRSLWSCPDPVLAQAGVAGELLVAKIRLTLAIVLLLIPVLDTLFFPVEPKEAIVGLSLAAGTFFGSIIIYLLISREYNPSWLSFVSSSFDVSLISGGLALFLVLNEPFTAVNSKVVFEGIFWRSQAPACGTTNASALRPAYWQSENILRSYTSRQRTGISTAPRSHPIPTACLTGPTKCRD